MRLIALTVSFLLFAAVGATANSSTPQSIKWRDLVPKLPPLVDPLANVGPEQRIELESVLWVRQLTKEERETYPEAVEEAEKYEREFLAKGFSVDKLIKDYAAWSAEQTRRQSKVRGDLDDKIVRLDGYLLPIEFSEEGVKDFLLVPYVGACIHVPAPPPNQIVFVRFKSKVKVTELYMAARLTGRMRTKASKRALSFVDGTADIPVGYELDVTKYDKIEEG
ncbi:MAG: DUF3299 domain-containing protein [Pseudomonadota bacterium]